MYGTYLSTYEGTLDSALGSSAATGFVGALAGFMAAYGVIMTIIGILMIVAQWLIFKKASKPGWASIVPIYNLVVLFKIVKLNAWLILLMLIPVANIILGIIVTLRLAKVFGKSTGFGIGLLFLSVIFYPILAFGSAKYEPEKLQTVE